MMNTQTQQGHAAILCLLLIPALFGLFSLATDGAQMLQDKARLQDALEAASLAIAAHNDDNEDDGSGNGSAVNQRIARSYVSHYMTGMEEIDALKIIKLSCEQIPDCVTGLAQGNSRFFEYQVTATTDHDPYFSGHFDASEKTYQIGGESIARKYQDNAVDVVFVADYSGSMGWDWSGGNQYKYQDLLDVIDAVTVELQKFNNILHADDNTVALVGYNQYVRLQNGDGAGNTCFVNELRYTAGLLDYRKTVTQVFVPKVGCVNNTSASFHDVLPTTDFESFNRVIGQFRPGGTTSSIQGVIRGAQLAALGSNPRRLMIILSDGNDYGSTSGIQNKTIANNLYGSTYQICHKIRSELDRQISGNQQVVSRIAVIGFDYDVASNRGLQDCAGAENVFKAQNKNDILNKILELISEEIGHLH
ncbi:pilus assembly protein [Vibrio sp. SM6]|uniref:Pilus assembly protein n=1 Tax=Vibrio agarilyticus TaxID=2726741 RepID=A0A7X8YH78_9VIBR|nr:TadE/TadG family type IV pilus assembly protein [Vibrio agarilyticus]NLS13072.1 pilus assembly protein [Vibrio agarilyticus]